LNVLRILAEGVDGAALLSFMDLFEIVVKFVVGSLKAA
jgi:hypothetical protein